MNIENGFRRLYNHERKLFGLQEEKMPHVNPDDFEIDVDTGRIGYNDTILEERQVNAQADTDWNIDEIIAIGAWGGVDYDKINNYLWCHILSKLLFNFRHHILFPTVIINTDLIIVIIKRQNMTISEIA